MWEPVDITFTDFEHVTSTVELAGSLMELQGTNKSQSAGMQLLSLGPGKSLIWYCSPANRQCKPHIPSNTCPEGLLQYLHDDATSKAFIYIVSHETVVHVCVFFFLEKSSALVQHLFIVLVWASIFAWTWCTQIVLLIPLVSYIYFEIFSCSELVGSLTIKWYWLQQHWSIVSYSEEHYISETRCSEG
jgi:hypothetical protein